MSTKALYDICLCSKKKTNGYYGYEKTRVDIIFNTYHQILKNIKNYNPNKSLKRPTKKK